MLNSFLVTLVNDPTPPVNPMSVVGDIVWPDTLLVKTYTPLEQYALNLLFDYDGDYLHTFLTAIQMLWVVEAGVVSDQIFADDSRVTYTRAQLFGQFQDVNPLTYSYEQGTRMLAAMDNIPAEQFLEGPLLLAYRSSFSKTDKLGAVIAHFGRRP